MPAVYIASMNAHFLPYHRSLLVVRKKHYDGCVGRFSEGSKLPGEPIIFNMLRLHSDRSSIYLRSYGLPDDRRYGLSVHGRHPGQNATEIHQCRRIWNMGNAKCMEPFKQSAFDRQRTVLWEITPLRPAGIKQSSQIVYERRLTFVTDASVTADTASQRVRRKSALRFNRRGQLVP